MTNLKQEYTEAMNAVAVIEAERRRLVAHTDAALETARDRVNAIENQIGDDVARCDGCEKYIFPGDMCSHDSINGLNFCEECTPTWQEMADEPESFTSGEDEYGDPVYLTKETVGAVIEEHLAGGGKMTDRIGLRPY